MNRVAVLVLALVAVLGVAPTGGMAASGEANVKDGLERRACTTINLGGPKIFAKQNMRCRKAKRYARRVYESNGEDEPRNFSCSSGSNFNEGGFCEHDSKPKSFGWHPADKA